MTTAEKLAEIAKRAKSIEEQIKDLLDLSSAITNDAVDIWVRRDFLFDSSERFKASLQSETQSLITAEIRLLDQELGQLSKPEYLAELLKEPNNA